MSPCPTVHIVEDDDAVRDALTLLLEVERIPVRGHRSAEAFLAAAPQASCVVTDVRMEGLGGVGLLRELKARRDTTPVIVVSGGADQRVAEETRALGAFRYIEKPFSADEILKAIRCALKLH